MEKDVGRIKKNDQTDIVVRLDDFGGRPGLTIREFVSGERYTGFTKSGTRIPAESFEEFKKMINSVKASDFVSDTPASTNSSSNGMKAKAKGKPNEELSEGDYM